MNIWKSYHFASSSELFWLKKPTLKELASCYHYKNSVGLKHLFSINKIEVKNNLKKGLLITP